MTALPHRVLLHQQLGSQLQTQLNGLRMRSSRLRPIGPDDTGLGFRLSQGETQPSASLSPTM
jgi:hypothetical protein